MGKIKQKQSGSWKPLKFDGTFISQGIEGLIGIEELTDYSIEKGSKKRKISNSTEKSNKTINKRPKIQSLGDDSSDKSVDESSIEQKRPKTSNKKRKKTQGKSDGNQKKNVLPSGSETESDPGSDGEEPHNEESSIIEDDENRDADTPELTINKYAWTSLGVPDIILKALADQNFNTPTPIQALTLAPAILGRRDILGAAETGSGKTLAFGIPILNGILESKRIEQEQNLTEHETTRDLNYDDEDDEDVGKFEESDDDEDVGKSEESDDDDSSVTESLHENNELDSESEQDGCDTDESAEESDFDEREEILGDELLDEQGIGCVRAIDNVQINDTHSTTKKPLYALVLTPTRELAMQVKNHLIKAAKYTGIRVAVVVGGMAIVKQERILSKGPEIVVATPGRLWELIEQGNSHLRQVNDIKYLAIDETDRMVERGHFQELQNLLEKINTDEEKLKKRQTFVFSATLTMVHDVPKHLLKKKSKKRNKVQKLTAEQKLQQVIQMLGIRNPKIVDVTQKSATASNLMESRIACTIDHKDYYLYYLLKRHAGRTLVFCNSIGCVRRLATLLEILDCNPLPLHAGMQQRQRLKNLERFQANENGLLIATDVAARGLDIPNVEHVIHYQVPRTSEGYVHRSGRTARAQKEGITILLMEPSEMQYYTRLCRTLGKTQDIPTFPVVDRLLIAIKERVDLSREIDKLELMCRRDNAQKGWLQKAVEDMDLVLDEDEIESTMESKETADLKKQLKIRRNQLKTLLSKPLFPRGFSGKYLDPSIKYQIDQGSQKAVDVMKQAMKENPRKKFRETPGIPKHKRTLKKKKHTKKKKH